MYRISFQNEVLRNVQRNMKTKIKRYNTYLISEIYDSNFYFEEIDLSYKTKTKITFYINIVFSIKSFSTFRFLINH